MQVIKNNYFKTFIGQENIKKNLNLYITLFKRKNTLKNLLFYGNSGTGKTTLAIQYIQAIEKKILKIQGPLLRNKTDIISLLFNIEQDQILFIDEIHGISSQVAEILFDVLDNKKLKITTGIMHEATLIEIELPNFALIGTTTKIETISQSLLSRFDYIAQLHDYVETDIIKIIKANLNFEISKSQLKELTWLSQLNPRQAQKIAMKVNDVLSLENKVNLVDEIKTLLELKPLGITKDQYKYLTKLMQEKYFSLKTLSGYLKRDLEYLKSYIEPYLLFLEFINIETKGRKITTKGKRYLQSLQN